MEAGGTEPQARECAPPETGKAGKHCPRGLLKGMHPAVSLIVAHCVHHLTHRVYENKTVLFSVISSWLHVKVAKESQYSHQLVTLLLCLQHPPPLEAPPPSMVLFPTSLEGRRSVDCGCHLYTRARLGMELVSGRRRAPGDPLWSRQQGGSAPGASGGAGSGQLKEPILPQDSGLHLWL